MTALRGKFEALKIVRDINSKKQSQIGKTVHLPLRRNNETINVALTFQKFKTLGKFCPTSNLMIINVLHTFLRLKKYELF